MKKTPFLFLALAITLASGTCKKESDTPGGGGGPAITYPTSGFLVSKSNYKAYGGYDSVMYRTATAGQTAMGYLVGAGKDADEVSFVNNSDNTVSIKLKKALRSGGVDLYYFVAKPNLNPQISSYPNNSHIFNWSETNTAEAHFVIKRSAADKLKFTIESKTYPGQFLGTGRWKNSQSDQDDNMVFTSKQQEWIFKAN